MKTIDENPSVRVYLTMIHPKSNVLGKGQKAGDATNVGDNTSKDLEKSKMPTVDFNSKGFLVVRDDYGNWYREFSNGERILIENIDEKVRKRGIELQDKSNER